MPMGGVPTTGADAVPKDGFVLDVREMDEWQAGHAPDAVHIPLGELPARWRELPDDAALYVVCRSGGRSAQATKALNQAGRNASNVAGGMQAWQQAGRPMVSESGGEPFVA